MKKLHIGNLALSVTRDQLREMFTPLGTVTRVIIITDPDTGRSKGIGYVVMDDDQAARRAIRVNNGKSLENQPITVALARTHEPRSGSGNGFRGDGHKGW